MLPRGFLLPRNAGVLLLDRNGYIFSSITQVTGQQKINEAECCLVLVMGKSVEIHLWTFLSHPQHIHNDSLGVQLSRAPCQKILVGVMVALIIMMKYKLLETHSYFKSPEQGEKSLFSSLHCAFLLTQSPWGVQHGQLHCHSMSDTYKSTSA